MTNQPPSPTTDKAVPDALVRRTRAILAFERLWPFAVATACLVGLFVAVSWLGLWLVLPPLARAAGVSLFGLGLAALAVRAARVGMPDRGTVLARLDRDSGLRHRPVSTGDDQLANAGSDPATRALWDLHRKRLRKLVAGIRVAPPSPRLVDRDIFALRGALLVALVAAGFLAGPEKYGRLMAAFAWRDVVPARPFRVDAWIDPPGYTGKPPLVLLGPAKPFVAGADPAISAPAGSTVVVRTAGDRDMTVTADGGLQTLPAKPGTAPAGAVRGSDHAFKLTTDGYLRIGEGGDGRVFALKAVPDLPPRITAIGQPGANLRGTLALAYAIADDYGVIGAEARFSNPVVRGRPFKGRSLVEPPKSPLALPALPGGLGDGKDTVDLSDSPWAGAAVTMVLSARDEGGNIGESAPVTLTLPSKPFSNPLARALVEQRRDLVLDPDDRAGVTTALDALQIAPDAFAVPPAIHLGLHTATLRLDAAKTDADLLGVADYLWEMALRIENGDLSKTEQDLRAAQKALRDALDRGAAPDEIRKLTEALRQQMDKYLAEMMRKDGNQSEAKNDASDRAGRKVTEQDLKSLLDRMEDAAKNGDTAEAQRLLEQLNAIMENLKTAKRGNSGQSQANREMNRSMSELDRMTREQGDVRDKTFKDSQDGSGEDQQGEQEGDQAGADQEQGGQEGDGQDQMQGGQGQTPGQSPGGSPGQTGRGQRGRGQQGAGLQDQSGQGQLSLGALQSRQQALREQLDDVQRRLRGLGMKGEQGLADAQGAMKEADDALGRGQGRQAVEAQGRALEGLQKGANGLSQQLAQQGGQEGTQADGDGGGEQDSERQQGENLDPLGRPRQGRGLAQGRDLDVSGGLAARAQQVLQELRRRLGDPTRSPDEQDYLERLLKRY